MNAALKWALGHKVEDQVRPNLSRGLPASWYRTSEMYELERRAVFSKYWMLVTHKNRFTTPGDYLRVTEAGFSIVLCLDRDGTINGFHNVCRHRGFPLIHQDNGNAKIFSCKYHGWSYGINGQLAKAPHFNEFSDFNKEDNNLFPVHIHVDNLGFVWVNLESSKVPSVAWNDMFEGVDTRAIYDEFNFDEYRIDHTWSLQGEYNWKTLGDNYNECLHCKTSHPDVSDLVVISAYRVEGNKGSLQHYNGRQELGHNDGKIHIYSTYYFPNACMTVSPDFMYLMRCVPTSVNTCSMEYEVYRHKDAADDDFNNIDQIFKRILAEDKWLCNLTQKNLDSGVYVNGQMHNSYESGPLYLQSLVKEAVMKHRAEEVKYKKEIWPATPSTTGPQDSTEDDDFCSSLKCYDRSRELSW